MAQAQGERPHVDYCKRDTEIVTLTLDMKVVKSQLEAQGKDIAAIKHALIGDMETDRDGMIVEHREHRYTLFGRHEGDKGLVGDMKWVKGRMNESKAFAGGASAAFGLVGALLAFLGWKGVTKLAEVIAR